MNEVTKYCHINEKHAEMYNHILNIENYAIWEWNITTNEIFISEKIKSITGQNFNNIKNMLEFINAIVYEKDSILATKDLFNYINGTSSLYHSMFRIKNNNGEIRWVVLKGELSKSRAPYCSLLSGIMLDITENIPLQRYDNLTKLPNREFFFEKVCNSIKEAKFHNKKGALIYIDIDNFRSLNDNFGQNIGDFILKLLSQFISSLLGKNDELARLGGNEFAILIHEFTNINEVTEIYNKILEYLKIPFVIMDIQIYITVSLGITIFPDDSSEIDELLKFCSFAIYKSKQNGKNICTFFDKHVSETYFRKILIASELKNSLANNELYIFYQPQINVKSNKIVGLEALLRWDNNKLGNVSPNEFIPIAESYGYIEQIGNWVLDNVLEAAGKWQEKGYKFNTIAINISPIQIKGNDFKDNFLNKCNKYNISPSLIELEITEDSLMEICKDKIEILNQLTKSGIHIAIDDFGTGYSSLNYLVTLPVNTLKIDKSFIDNIKNHKYKAVIENIINLSRSLGYKIIAEGVETKEEKTIITDLGCNIIQGYYFHKPLPENEIENLLIKQR